VWHRLGSVYTFAVEIAEEHVEEELVLLAKVLAAVTVDPLLKHLYDSCVVSIVESGHESV
jgi:hypothetical protein